MITPYSHPPSPRRVRAIIVTRYILKEILPQFFSTLIVFCAVIVVSQLVRLSNVLVAFGLTLENIFLPFLYIIVPFLPIIIPMSYLFGTMIAFSRLSADGELTALLAAGFGLKRAIAPTLAVAAILYAISSLCAIHLEAWGRREFVQFIYRKTQTEIDNMIRFKIQAGVFLNDFLDYVFYTESISPDRSRYSNVLLAPQHKSHQDFLIMSPKAEISGSVASGDLRMVLFNGITYSLNPDGTRVSSMSFRRAEIDILRVFQEKILGDDTAKDDYRGFRAGELKAYVSQLKHSPQRDDKTYRKAAYLYYSRFANAFVILAFSLFAMILAQQDQRHGKNRAYLGSIGTLILCFVAIVAFRWIAEQAYLPVLMAIWLPQLFILAFAIFCIYQKSRLPPSEPILAWKNLPFFG